MPKLCEVLLLTLYINSLGCSQPVTFSGSNRHSQDLRVLTSERFAASELKKAGFEYNFKTRKISENFTLKAKKPEIISFNQISRQKIKESHLQGYQGDLISEHFPIKTPDKLDLLLVIDNSSSMSPYQTRLASGLLPLLSHLENTDWQIMVVTTSPIRRRNRDNTEIIKVFGCPRLNKSDPKDGALIKKSEFEKDAKQAIKRFEWKVSVGEAGDPVERGLLAAIHGLKGECGDTTQPWVRPDSHKAVLLLTDEENCGSDPDQNCDDSADSQPDFFIKEAPLGTQFFGLLHDKDLYSESCQDEGYIRKPDDYRAVIKATGGLEGNICAPSYETILREISKNIHPVNKLSYPLKPIAERTDLEIEINHSPVDIPFDLTDNTLHFKGPLPPSAEVLTVKYRTRSIPKFNSIALKSSFDLPTLEVTINGQTLDPKEYSIVPMTNDPNSEKKLVFIRQPSDLATIEVSGRSAAVPLPNSFDLGQSLPPNILKETLKFTLNGQPVDNAIFNPEQSVLDLGTPPRDGDQISVHYETTDSRQTAYPITSIATNEFINNIEVIEATTNLPISSQVVNGSLVIDSHEVLNGREITASYSISQDLHEFNVTLPHDPVVESLQIVGGRQDCISSHHMLDRSIFFPCPDRAMGDFKVDYQYWDEIKTDFTIPASYNPNLPLQVTLDGVETLDFEIINDQVHIDSSRLTQNSIVEIHVESRISY